jgi:hypothetical protein
MAMDTLESLIQRTGVWDNQPAFIVGVLARREGSASTPFIVDDLCDIVPFPITAGNYPELAGTEALEVVSTSPNDTAGGTGVRSVDITYLDTNGDKQTVAVTLNGTTPVSLGAIRSIGIWWMHSKTVGSGKEAAGTIDLRTTTGAVIHERIAAGGNQSLSGRIKIPRGYTGYAISFIANNGSDTGRQEVRLRFEADRDTNEKLDGVYTFRALAALGPSQFTAFDLPFLIIPPLADAKFSTISSTSNTGSVTAQMHVIIRRN